MILPPLILLWRNRRRRMETDPRLILQPVKPRALALSGLFLVGVAVFSPVSARAEGFFERIFGAQPQAPLETTAGRVGGGSVGEASVGEASVGAVSAPTSGADIAEKMRGTTGSSAVVAVPVDEPPVAGSAQIGAVEVGVIGAQPLVFRAGLLPAARAGLPADLWGMSPERDLVALLARERLALMPELQDLMHRMMIAELDPPQGAPALAGQPVGAGLFLARIDRLMALGALDPALSLLELAGVADAQRFQRYFDLSLLSGEEDRACGLLFSQSAAAPVAQTEPVETERFAAEGGEADAPQETVAPEPETAEPASPRFDAALTPAPLVEIFCRARIADWAGAQARFEAGVEAGEISAETADLVIRFLDDAMVDEGQEIAPPASPSPLEFRLMEAIGQPLPTTYLALPFAAADLRANTGWRARLEAAERLAQAGTLDANQMLGLYTEESPAASGGVWERARAMAALDAAVLSRDAQSVTLALEPAVVLMAEAELEMVPATLYGGALREVTLGAEAGRLALRLGLLSEEFGAVAETAARAKAPLSADDRFLVALARGKTLGGFAQDALGSALNPVFEASPAPAPALTAALIAQNRRGEAILRAIDDISEGARGDYRRVTEGLLSLRALGLETEARRTALQLMILERRG